MACILNIETATPLCSVALAVNGKVIAQRETLEEKSHAARLTVFIEEILAEKKIRVSDLDAVAVGKGPGSYTGLAHWCFNGKRIVLWSKYSAYCRGYP